MNGQYKYQWRFYGKERVVIWPHSRSITSWTAESKIYDGPISNIPLDEFTQFIGKIWEYKQMAKKHKTNKYLSVFWNISGDDYSVYFKGKRVLRTACPNLLQYFLTSWA